MYGALRDIYSVLDPTKPFPDKTIASFFLLRRNRILSTESNQRIPRLANHSETPDRKRENGSTRRGDPRPKSPSPSTHLHGFPLSPDTLNGKSAPRRLAVGSVGYCRRRRPSGHRPHGELLPPSTALHGRLTGSCGDTRPVISRHLDEKSLRPQDI